MRIVQLLNTARDLASYNRPSRRDYSSVKSYFDEEAPVCNNETYIYCREDLVTLKPGRENAWLDAVMERILQKCSCKLIQVRPFERSQDKLRSLTDLLLAPILLCSVYHLG